MDTHIFRIAEKIAALLMGVASEEDRKQVGEWEHKDPRHAELSERLHSRDDFEENQRQINSFSVDEAWERIEKRLDAGARKEPLRIWEWWKYAAVMALLIGGGVLYFTWQRPLQVETTTLTQQMISSGRQGAELILGNGKVITVTPDNQFVLSEADGTLIRKDSAGIDYTQGASGTTDTVVYNQMKTLTGMEYTLTLSDGTQVFLNAESWIRFPATFRGTQRVVELNGEAYFKVAKDARHPFVVKMNGVELKVLGTSFNMRSYSDEKNIVATLVEGRVEVNGMKMQPGEQALYVRENRKLMVNTVDVNQYTAWHQGYFVFRNERLEDMMKTLARWYGVEYHFVDESTKDIRLGARFARYDDMKPIINMLQQTDLVEVLQTNRCLYFSVKK